MSTLAPAAAGTEAADAEIARENQAYCEALGAAIDDMLLLNLPEYMSMQTGLVRLADAEIRCHAHVRPAFSRHAVMAQ